MRYTDWTLEYAHKLPTRFVNRKDIIMGCAFDSSHPHALVLWGSTYFCWIDLHKSMGSPDAFITNNLKRKEIDAKRAKRRLEDQNVVCLDKEPEDQHECDSFKMDHRYSPIMMLDFIKDEMVVMERPALEVMKALPMSYYKHHYGT